MAGVIELALASCGFVLCVFMAKVFFSSASGDAKARRVLRHDSGINIVHGGGGDQSGKMVPDKRVSREFYN